MSSGDDSAAVLYVALGRLVRDLRRVGGAGQLGPSSTAAMVTLAKSEEGLRVGELAEAEGISAPSVTRIVHALEEQGLVVRTTDPRDARCQLVRLTPSGTELIGSGTESKMAALRERIQRLDDAQRATLEAALPAFEALAGLGDAVAVSAAR